jgi:hypothetical protein
MYRTLSSDRIVETLERLEARIHERFPGSGLGRVCAELTAIARQSKERSAAIARPDLRIRLLVAVVLALSVWLLFGLGSQMLAGTRASDELYGTIQGIDSALNLVLVMGASLFFMVSLEDRLKRKRALHALHELRSIIHVIDMHQLTKDPSTEVSISQDTPSSPKRTLQRYELIRYLDYCSEMLSLSSKVAVLYSQSFPDPVVAEAVNDLERTAASLAQKIWQKINILHRSLDVAAAQQPAPPVAVLPPRPLAGGGTTQGGGPPSV